MGFLSKVFKGLSKVVGVILKPISKLLQDWLTPDLPKKDGLKLQRVGSNQDIPVVYGTRIVGGIIVDKNVTDGEIDFDIIGLPFTIKGGNKNGLLHVLAVFCYGEVDDIEEFYFNGTPSTDAQFKKDGRDMFGIDYRLGGSDNDTTVAGTGKFNKFDTDNSRYEGLCYALFTFEQDPDQSIWRGEPEITAKIRGKKCYDWRTDITQYTENPAVHMVDYVKSGVYGISLGDSDINYPYFTQVANACDIEEVGNSVTTTTGYYDRDLRQYIETGEVTTTETFKRFTNNTIIDTGRELFENMKELALPFRGYFPEPDGRLAIASEDAASSVFSLSGDNIVSTITRTQAAANERYNKVIVRFPNRLNKYEFDEVSYPDESDPIYNAWIEEDNFLKLENTIEIEHCVYKAEALQLAEVAAKASRNNEQVQFTATFEAIELDVGDVVSITDETRGWIDRDYRIIALEYRDDALVDITGILHNNTIYPWVTKDYKERIGGVFLGDPYSPSAPFNLVLTPDPTLTTTGTLTWSHEGDSFVRNYRVVVNRSGEPVLDINTQSRSYVVPTLDAGTYEIDVYAITTIGAQSDEASLALVLTAPATPDDIDFVVGDWTIEAQPIISSGGVGFGTTFEFDYVFGDGLTHTPQPRFDGASLVATGLIPLTQYTFFARSINAYGASQWYSESVTTTNTGNQTAAQLDPIRDELDSINLLLDDLPEEIGDFSVISGKVDALETDVADINNEIDAAYVEIENIQDDLSLDINAYVYEITGLHNDWLNREAIRTDEVKQETEKNELKVQIDSVSSSLVSEITGVRVDIDGNASAINSLKGEVESVEGNVEAAFLQINALEVSADGNAQAITQIGNEVSSLYDETYDSSNEVVAANELILASEFGNAGLIRSQIALGTRISDAQAGVNAATEILSLSELDEDGNTKATNALTTRVDSVESDTSANTSIIQQSALAPDGSTKATISLATEIEQVEGEVLANTLLIQQSGLDAQGNTTALLSLKGQVDNPSTGLGATFNIAGQAKNTADDAQSSIVTINARLDEAEGDIVANAGLISQVENDITGNTNALNALTATVNDPSAGLSATNNLAQSAKVTADTAEGKADTNASAITVLGSRVDDTENDISAVNTIAQSAETKATTADGKAEANASAITAIESRVDDAESDISAVNTIAQQAQLDSSNNASAITQIQTRVSDNENFASAQLILNSTYEGDIDTLSARAFLGTNVNGRVTGVTIADSGSEQQIIFQSDAVAFTDNAGTLMIYYDTVNGRYVFDGEIIADTGTFKGNVSGATITGGSIDIGGGEFTVNSSGELTANSASLTGGLKTNGGTGNRAEIGTNSTYDIWIGQGARNDANGVLWVKPDGTGFIKGEFFQGEIIESKLGTGDTTGNFMSATVTHNSAGKPVEVTAKGNIYFEVNGDTSSQQLSATIKLKKGSTTLVQRAVAGIAFEFAGKTVYNYSTTIDYIDTSTSVGNRNYSVEVSWTGAPSGTYSNIGNNCIVKTFENKLA